MINAPVYPKSNLTLSLKVGIGNNQLLRNINNYNLNYAVADSQRIDDHNITLNPGDVYKANPNETTLALIISTNAPIAFSGITTSGSILNCVINQMLVLDCGVTSYKLTNAGQIAQARVNINTATAAIPVISGVSFYGVAADPGVYNSAFINSFLPDGQGKATLFSVNAGSLQYIWYAYPTALGTAKFTVNGFAGGFQLVSTTVDMTGTPYTLYRSNNLALGATDVTVS